jgi:RNA polymerase sigma-70 factor, ECF subfamily
MCLRFKIAFGFKMLVKYTKIFVTKKVQGICFNNIRFVSLQEFTNISLLTTALKQKDRSAFTYLYDNYSAALYGVILKVVNNEEDANDVLQDAFVNIWKSIETFDEKKGATLFTWMLNVCRNKAIDRYRQKNRIASNQKELSNVSIGNEHTLHTIQKIDTIGIGKLVSNIKPEHYQLIQLHYYKGLTHQEIADITNIPLGTIKTRLRSAITELKQVFGA